MKKQRANSGMTLVEVIISMAIVCVAALLILSAVSVSQTLVRRGVDTQNNTLGALSGAEGFDTGTEDDGTVTFKAGTDGYTIEGKYYIGTQGNVGLATFVPGE